MSNDSPTSTNELFVILGASHPQRFEVLWQIIDYLHYNGEKVTLFTHKDESDLPDSKAKDRVLKKGLQVEQWELDSESTGFKHPPAVSEKGRITILLGHGSLYLVDTLEVLSQWLPLSDMTLQRVMTWVDAERLSKNPDVKKWYECSFHFSDLVILDEFKNLPLAWLKEFRDYFKSQSYPCIVENTKKGRLNDLYVTMDNQTRRISQVFEVSDEFYSQMELKEELKDGVLIKLPIEPFFERSPEGRRSQLVPDL